MAAQGWIKLHRCIIDNWVWDCEFSYGQAWIDLLMKACHKPNKLMIKGQMISLERGQQARSEVTLAKEWKWSRGKVRRFLSRLEGDSMIVHQTDNLTSIITICNYDSFQGGDTADGTADGTANGQQTVHKQEVKNLRSKETDHSSPDGDQKQQSKKAVFRMMAEKYMELIPEMPAVDIEANANGRETKAANFYAKHKFTNERWEAYLMAVRECSWMFEDRPSFDGKVWKKKNFDFLITEKCYLGVKEDRYQVRN